MQISMGKIAPTAMVLAALGYSCWPYLEGPVSRSQTDQTAKPSEIAASLLSPAVDGALKRDPFRTMSVTLADEAENNPDLASRVQGAAHQAAADASDNDPESDDKSGDSNPSQASSSTGLALNATYIRGDFRAALINGRLYTPGDTLATANSTTPTYVVAEIYPHKVLLEHPQQSLELGYSDAVSDRGSPSAARGITGLPKQAGSGSASKVTTRRASPPHAPGSTRGKASQP